MTRHRPAASTLRATLLLALGGVLALGLPSAAVGAEPESTLAGVEGAFREAIRRVSPATVTCVPRGVPRPFAGFSSGVLVSATGLVLSDGDVGLKWRQAGDPATRVWLDDVEVRVPRNPTGGRYEFRAYRARVLHRDRKADTSLLEILSPRPGGFPFVPVGRSDDVRVGDFAFTMGTAFDEVGRTPATLTVGLIASSDPAVEGAPGGRHEFLYMSAAVNQGVNGGPVVGLGGHLIGTVSTWVEPGGDAPHQLLGRVVPIDRIRALHARAGRATAALAAARPGARPVGPAHSLEQVFGAAGRLAARSVVSLEVRRRRPVSTLIPLDGDETTVPRYEGPVSGVLVSKDGWIVTSLYNLTNVGAIVDPLWRPAAQADVAAGLADVLAITAHFPGGATAEARLLGHDRRLGIALLQADLERARAPQGWEPTLPRPAPRESLVAGRFVLAVGHPFGAKARPEPLLSVGLLSRWHPDTASAAWRGQWQTDAAGLDTNSGGAAVDLEGRLLGLFTLWYPARHGRNSGIAFVVPWSSIRGALPDLARGKEPLPALLGVRFEGVGVPRLAAVTAGTAASRAGLRPGDVLVRMDAEEIIDYRDAIVLIGHRCAGDHVRIELERGSERLVIDAVLGPRPPRTAPR